MAPEKILVIMCPLTFAIGRTKLGQNAPIFHPCLKEQCGFWVKNTNLGFPFCAKTLAAISLDNIAYLLKEQGEGNDG